MDPLVMATFFVALISSVLSGMSGSGGGFIMSPYWLLIGLTPAQSAAAGAFMALGMSASSVAAFKGSGHMPGDKRLMKLLLVVTLVASAIGPFFLQTMPTEVFKPIIAGFTLLTLPMLFMKRNARVIGHHGQVLGVILLSIVLLASSFIMSSAFSIAIAVILSQMFGLTILQGTAVRRMMGVVQATVIFTILLSLGNFVWAHALAGIAGGIMGSFLGTRYAIKQGEDFARYALATGAIISAILLLW